MDAKQIEMIKKLIRLANNNPNDNEANVAARRVCAMLKDYVFVQTILPSTPKSPNSPPPRYDPFEELFRKARQQAEDFTRKHYSNPYSPPFAKEWGQDNTFTEGENIKRNLKCSKCGYTKSTRFRGLEESWVCMECRGKEYTKKEYTQNKSE